MSTTSTNETVRFFDRDITVTFDIDPEVEAKSKSAMKRNKRATTCKLLDKNGKVVAQDVAKCGPNDVFNEAQGKLISLNRALDKVARSAAKSEKYKVTQAILGA